jgi:hypothetical protein
MGFQEKNANKLKKQTLVNLGKNVTYHPLEVKCSSLKDRNYLALHDATYYQWQLIDEESELIL